VKVIGQINSVANPEGTGRDDLGVEIIVESESIIRRISPTQSKAVRGLAEKIKKSFLNLRLLFGRYEQNIEIVDPQLKNNPELVEALVAFESSWEKGKTYFLSAKKCNQLVHFSQIIEATAEKRKEFAEQIENRDAEIFVSLPCLLILKCLEQDDRNLCKAFYASMFLQGSEANEKYISLIHLFKQCRKIVNSDYDFYNLVEMKILEITYTEKEDLKINDRPLFNEVSDKMLHKMKQLAMEMSRSKPQEWNKFLDVVLISNETQQSTILVKKESSQELFTDT